jgi:hypothetical protein
MRSLLGIRDALSRYASGLHLEEDDLPTTFETDLADISAAIAEDVAAEFSLPLAKRAVALRLATKVLVEDPSPDSMAFAVAEFGALLAGLRTEMRARSNVAEWCFAHQFVQISDHLTAPRPEENPAFAELPRMLMSCDWVQQRLCDHAASAGLNLDDTPVASGFHQGLARKWMRKVTKRREGRLYAAVDDLTGAAEHRARQIWFLRRSLAGEQSLPQMYVFAHTELFPDMHSPISETRLALEVAKLKGLALGLQLPDLALCFEQPEWIAQYALSYLLPPSPEGWAVRSASHLGRLLHGRVSRWYFYPFDHRIEPLEIVATVLKVGRPLFYERVAAHALLEYSLLQGVSFTHQAAASWLEVHAGLEREFQILFDAYLLRVLYYPRLRTPEGWCRYLGALDALHYGGRPDADFLEFRHGYLARRGLQSSIEILYRTTESHSSIN